MPANILVIEDNPTNLELMIYLLRAYSYEPFTALDGVEGIEVAQRERPDLIVCDVQLPKADGFEVVRRLKAQREFKRVPVIAVTALAMVGDRERLLNAGFDGYIAKPIQPESFVALIEAFLSPELRAEARIDEVWREETVQSRAGAPLAGTVLAIDDTEANRDLIKSILEPHGYRVTAVSTIAEAQEALRGERPDMIITDVHLRDGTSLAFIRVLREDSEFRSLPVLVQSASAEELEREGIEALGIRLLSRPLSADKLLLEIQMALSSLAAREVTKCPSF